MQNTSERALLSVRTREPWVTATGAAISVRTESVGVGTR